MKIPIECECGSLAGVVESQGLTGCRAVCLCDDCQAFAHYLGKASVVLDGNGGTDVIPLTPARIQITKGLENLKCLRLSSRGLVRWYARCCKTPVANTPISTKIPYVGVIHSMFEKTMTSQSLDEAFGPIQARIQGRFGIGNLPPGTSNKASPSFLFRVGIFILSSWVRREKQPSPFFDEGGAPKSDPLVLTKLERESLRPFCGPRPQPTGSHATIEDRLAHEG